MTIISVVIPVYNSESCLVELTRQIHSNVKAPHEIVYVNDQSTDQSWSVITRLVQDYNNIVGVNLRKNSGQDNAIMAGLSRARGQYVVIMDDDLQHAPADILALYNKCSEGYDVCYASFIEKRQKLWKNFGSWLNGKVAECMLKKPKDLYLSPFKIIKAEVVKEFGTYNGPYPYVDGLILSVTDNITQIPAQHHDRHKGKSAYSLIKSLKVWISHLTGFSVLPLRLATLGGICSALVGFGLGIYYIMIHFTTENVVEGWTTLVSINLFLGGLMLMALGLIGEYVGRSYLVLNSKPPYNIKETIGYDPLPSMAKDDHPTGP